MSNDKSDVIRAAGCLVYRRCAGDQVEVLVVHRQRYDDWDFPKGKREDGESDEECARRETEEETGFIGELGPELESDSYYVGDKPKSVRWWLMKATGGSFIANEEVDEVRWLLPEDAMLVLSYGHAKRMLRTLDRMLRTAGQSLRTADDREC